MGRLDDQVARLIREQQTQTLGANAPRDEKPLAVTLPGSVSLEKAYDYSPKTLNPSVDELPATLAPVVPLETDPDKMTTPTSQSAKEQNQAEALGLDLQKSLQIAIAQSRDYLSQRESLYLSALSVLAEEHLWGPRFFSTISSTVSGTPEDGEHTQALSVISQFGVTQRLPYGGTVSATALVDFVHLLKDTSNGAGEGQDAALNLTARFPLLRGAGDVAQESRLQAARNLIYATRSFERFRRQFLLDISTRYFNLLQTQAQVANLERQVNNLEWLSSRIQAMANAGRQPYFEVQRAQQQVLFARNNLLNAQESYASSLDNYKIQLGLDTSTPIRIIPSEVMIPEPLMDVTSSIQTALSLRLDVQTSSDQLVDSRRGIEVARNGLLPNLDVVGSLGLRTDPKDKYAGLNLDPSQGSYSVGMVLELPLDKKLEEISLRRSRLNHERARRDFDLLKERIALDVRQSIRNVSQANFTLMIQNQNIEMAQKRLEGVVLRLANLAPRDFTDAESDLLEARNRRDGAVRDLRVSILRYLLDTGQLRVASDGQWLPPAKLVPSANPAEGIEEDSPGNAYDMQLPATSSQTTPAAGSQETQPVVETPARNDEAGVSPDAGNDTGDVPTP